MTNCDRRLLNVKASVVPFMKYVDGCVSCVEIGAVKESQDFWGPAFEIFNIDTETVSYTHMTLPTKRIV